MKGYRIKVSAIWRVDCTSKLPLTLAQKGDREASYALLGTVHCVVQG